VKVTDLKRTPLEEGFIDNLVGKALGMSGGDGITGFIRSLQGEGAALKKLSDAIEVGLVGALRREAGQNFAKIQRDQEPMTGTTLTAMIKLGLKSAEAVSSKETGTATAAGTTSSDPVSAAQIAELIKNNKREVVQVAGGGVNAIVDAIVQVAGGAEATAIENLKYEKAVDGICLALAAATIITTGEDLTSASFKIAPADQQKFEQVGAQILDILLDPSNGLKQNQDFIDNIKNLIIVHYLNERVRKRYAVMTATQLAGLSARPPDIITSGEYKRFLSIHNPSIDTTALDKVITAVKTAVQSQFGMWLNFAADESATGRKPQQSLNLYTAWARTVIQMLDQSKYGSAPETPAAPGAPEASPLDDPEKFIEDLEKYLASGGTITPELLALLKELVK
jgi:hypothetical protein